MARLGTTGCGFEQPLESAYRALQPGKNPGFLPRQRVPRGHLHRTRTTARPSGGALFGDPNGRSPSPLGPRTSFRCWEFGVQCDNDPNPRAFGTRTGCVPAHQLAVHEGHPAVRGLPEGPEETIPTKVIVAGIIGNVDDQQHRRVGADPDDTTPPGPGRVVHLDLGLAATRPPH
jgi:hypothetical protein